MKTCKKCKKQKPATNEYFSKYSKSPDGLFFYCKECQKEISFKYTNKYKQLYENNVIDKWYRKTCTICKQKKHYSEYNINQNNADGLYDYCISCQNKFEKQCKKCEEFKPFSEFNRYKDGLFYYCRECQKEINQEQILQRKLKTHKFCSKCGNLKKFKEFYQSSITEDGLHSECKACCITNEPTSSQYRKKRDTKFYVNYWSGQVGLSHSINTTNWKND